MCARAGVHCIYYRRPCWCLSEISIVRSVAMKQMCIFSVVIIIVLFLDHILNRGNWSQLPAIYLFLASMSSTTRYNQMASASCFRKINNHVYLFLRDEVDLRKSYFVLAPWSLGEWNWRSNTYCFHVQTKYVLFYVEWSREGMLQINLVVIFCAKHARCWIEKGFILHAERLSKIEQSFM
jgi:hypothetical protein